MLQPLASSIGANSASVSHLVLFVCMGSRLLLRLGASLFFIAGIALAQSLGQTVAAVALRRCGQGLATLHRSAVLVGAPVRCQHQRQQAQPHRPAHASARRTPSSITAAEYGLPPFSWTMMPTTIPRSVAGFLMSIGAVGCTPILVATARA